MSYTIDLYCITIDLSCITIDLSSITIDLSSITIDLSCITIDLYCITIDLSCIIIDLSSMLLAYFVFLYFRSLGLNTVTAYQRAKVQALKIVNIRIGSNSNQRQRTLSEVPVFQVRYSSFLQTRTKLLRMLLLLANHCATRDQTENLFGLNTNAVKL